MRYSYKSNDRIRLIHAMNNPAFDLNLLRVFDAMMRQRSVTLAAAQVGLSQPATSSALARLRHHLRDELFVKSRGSMVPTPRALELAGPIRRALDELRQAVGSPAVFDPGKSRRQFRLFMTDVGELTFLPPLLRHLAAIAPDCSVRTTLVDAERLPDLLEAGEIDLALGYLPRLGGMVNRQRLFQEHYVCVTRTDHYLGASAPISLAEFRQARHVLIDPMGGGHEVVERALNDLGIGEHVRLRVPHYMAVALIVADSDLIATVPSSMAKVCAGITDIKVHPVPLAIPSFDVAIFWHERFGNDLGSRWLRDQFTTLFFRP